MASLDGSEGLDQMKRYLKKAQSVLCHLLISYKQVSCITRMYNNNVINIKRKTSVSETKTDCGLFSLIRKK